MTENPANHWYALYQIARRRAVELLSVGGCHIVDLKQPIDKHPQPHLGGNAARRNMRAVQEAEILKVLHDISDCGG